MSTPGRKPAAKSSPMDAFARTPYTTKTRLGGIIGPIVAAAPIRPTEKSSSYPASRQAFSSMAPTPPAPAPRRPVHPRKNHRGEPADVAEPAPEPPEQR